MPSSAPASAPSFSSGNGASVYQPQAQPAFDQLYQGIVGGLSPYALDPSSTPAGQAYPQAQTLGSDLAALFGQGQTGAQSIINNPGYASLVGAASGAQPGAQDLYNSAISGGGNLGSTSSWLLNSAATNPFLGSAQGGAESGAAIGQQAASSLAQQVPGITASADQVRGTINPILSAGFDPQQALYQQTLGQLTQQTNAANANSGLSGTPYGQSVLGNTLGNFGINWQNQQLGRETSAANAAGTAAQTGAGLDQTALGIGSGASNLAASAAALPFNVYNQNNTALEQARAAASGGLSGQQTLGSSGLSNLLQGSGALYNANNTQGSNTLSALTNEGGLGTTGLSGLTSGANIGNNQFLLPQQVLQDLQSYLQLGQASSGLSANIGQQGLQEQQNAFSGLGSAAGAGSNLLFGNSSGGLLGTGAGGLFGSAAGSTATDALGNAVPLGSLEAVDASGSAGSGLASLLPFASGSA